MNNTSNLVDATVTKIEERIHKMTKLRKDVISNTNNFKEFKIMKSEIIHQLVEYEKDFRQLSTIIKSVTSQNTIQKETAELNQKQAERFENKIKIMEKENFQIFEDNQDLQRRLTLVTSSNCDKDNYINDLLTKITYLENIIKDYQKKYDIMKYSRDSFEHNIPGKTDNYLSRYNEYARNQISNINTQTVNLYSNNNNQTINYSQIKKDLNLNYNYEKGSNEITNNQQNNYTLHNVNKTTVNMIAENNLNKSLLNKTTGFSYNENSNNNDGYNKKFYNTAHNFNSEIDRNPERNQKKSLLSEYTPYERAMIKNSNSEFVSSQLQKNSNTENIKESYERSNQNLNNKMKTNIPEKEFFNQKEFFEKNLRNGETNNKQIEEKIIQKNTINEFENYFDERESDVKINQINVTNIRTNNLNDNSNKSGNEFNYTNEAGFGSKNSPEKKENYEIRNNILKKNANISEKDKANLVSEILLKIFSSENVNTTLKRKYGEDFQLKLTDKDLDSNFLLDIEKDVNLLLNKEKIDFNPKNDGVNYKEIRKSITNYSLDMNNVDIDNPYFKKKINEMNNNNLSNTGKININEMKYHSNFDQLCGTIEKNNSNNHEMNSKIKSSKQYKSENVNGSIGSSGYSSLKEYFVRNSNYVKGLGRKQTPDKVNKSEQIKRL